MYEPHEDRKVWARQQLTAAGVDETLSRAIMSTFQTWLNLMPGDDEQALQIFVNLVHGQAIEYHKPDQIIEQWEPIRPGFVKRGDYVRVKMNAYSGEAGLCHNGRRGPVVRISSGDVIVRYDDELAPNYGPMGSHHSPFALERKI